MECSRCGREIEPFDYYLPVKDETICEDCVHDGMTEYDPESDYIDMMIDEMIERRHGLTP